MKLKILLVVHAIITLAAAVVLIVAPTVIPKTVNIQLKPEAYLLSYFLGAAELGIAYLSFFSRNLTDKSALRVIIWTFIVFHLTTALVEVYALFQGVDTKIIGNIILRIIISALFYYFGIYENKTVKNHLTQSE